MKKKNKDKFPHDFYLEIVTQAHDEGFEGGASTSETGVSTEEEEDTGTDFDEQDAGAQLRATDASSTSV